MRLSANAADGFGEVALCTWMLCLPNVGDLDDSRTVGIDLDAVLIVFPEDHGLAVLEPDSVLVPA